MRKAIFSLITAAVMWGWHCRGWAQLAVELAQEGDHAGAALEFRRMALDQDEARRRAGLLWASAYEYYRAGDLERADKLVGAAEDAAPALRAPSLLLRGDVEGARKNWEESAFYYEGALSAADQQDVSRYAARKAAAAKVHARDLDGASRMLACSPELETNALAALERYRTGHDRSPMIGGVLGLVPGAGYFYSGEWANGFRSLILNSIFLFGMVHTAREDQWGAFAVITFFEFTWYSGSIYGGVDAAHRYNRRRLDDCVASLSGGTSFEPDYGAFPEVKLKFRF